MTQMTSADPEIDALVDKLRGPRLPPPTARRAIRVAADRTLQDIADLIGVDIMSVSRWERGISKPIRMNRIKYARALAALTVIAAERAAEQTQK